MKHKIVEFGKKKIGGGNFVVTAGPCSIESEKQFLDTATWIKEVGGDILRGGIYKLRTSPDSFQGLEDAAFPIVEKVKSSTEMDFITEVTDPRQIEELDEIVDIFQVGSRNMYNYSLLKELGRSNKAVLLKRGFSATIDEWLKAADYVLNGGNHNLVLCERGIRGFDNKTRNVLDLGSVAYLKENSELPIVVDPSHGTGLRELVLPMSMAAIAAGADGLMVEVHPFPEKALSDSRQAIDFNMYKNLISQIRRLYPHLMQGAINEPNTRAESRQDPADLSRSCS